MTDSKQTPDQPDTGTNDPETGVDFSPELESFGAGDSFALDESSKNDSGPENSGRRFVLSRRLAFFLTMAVGILMVWVFILGILVGRGSIFQSTAFKDLEKRLAGSEPEKTSPLVEVTEEPARPSPPKPKLTFYDSLAKSNVPPSRIKPKPVKPKPAPIKKKAPAAPAQTKDMAKKEAVPGPESREKAVSGPKPQDRPGKKLIVTSGVRTVERKASAAPPPRRKQGENFSVQVAAAGSVAEAEKMVKKLRGKGYDAYYYQVELKGRTYFRVRIGRHKTRDQAQASLERLKTKGFKSMFVSELTD